MIFDLSTLTETQRAIIEEAVARSSFDFEALLPQLQSEKGKSQIPVEFVDLSTYGSQASQGTHAHVHTERDEAHALTEPENRSRVLGLAWYSGKVSIEQTLSPELAREVFLAEGAHMIDFFWMTDDDRAQIARSLHGGADPHHDDHGWFEERGDQDYYDWPGETFMDLFILATTDLPTSMGGRWTHRITPHSVEEARRILSRSFKAAPEPTPPVTPPPIPPPLDPIVVTPAPPEPAPEPEPPAEEIVAWATSKRSKVYHTICHTGAKTPDTAPLTWADPAASGRRHCRFCVWANRILGYPNGY